MSTWVPRAMFTRFFVEHGLFQYFYIEQTNLGVGFHNLMNDLKPLTFRVNTFQLLLSMKFLAKREYMRSTGIHFQKKHS